MKTLAAFRSASRRARVGLANGRSLLTLLVVACVAMPAAQAQTTWLGGGADGNWSTSDNWSSAVNNNFSGGLVFAGSSQTSTNNDRTGVTATTLTFAAAAAPFTISGSQFALGGSLVNSSGTTQTIDANMNVTGNRSLTLNGNIVINGVLSGATMPS